MTAGEGAETGEQTETLNPLGFLLVPMIGMKAANWDERDPRPALSCIDFHSILSHLGSICQQVIVALRWLQPGAD